MSELRVEKCFELRGRDPGHLATRLLSLLDALDRRQGKVVELRWSKASRTPLVAVVYELPTGLDGALSAAAGQA